MSLPSPTVHLILPYSSGNHTGRGGKVKTRTIANITKWPKRRVELLKKLLRGDLDETVRDVD
ncbi:hypothetical protein [Syntrophorhabdus aromaticivorans]|uniref:hypothetical protein n=1 Tax=Syntrophorhabdus aromaticivorans TaxID=328301 RepID=UPI00041B3EA6|nr:hypothetical protein [Syntrophorhabdus aromaticivorans]